VCRLASDTGCHEILQVITSPPAGGDMKVRETIWMIEEDGWFLVATRGSHRQFKHPSKSGRVTIAGKPSDDLAPGTLNSILKQAGLKEKK
jgi:predicted RNA binding protein YcfA (HicA-like mRNA interferase family)